MYRYVYSYMTASFDHTADIIIISMRDKYER